MIRDRAGTAMLEYIVGAAILITLLATALYSVFETLGDKIVAVNDSL